MKRTLNLCWHAFNIEARQILAYRWEFWSGFLGQTFIVVTVSYFLWSSIFKNNQVEEMQGFDLKMIILYYLMAHVLFKMQQGFATGFFSRDIYYGTLNKYLLYPFSPTLLKFASYCAYSAFYYCQFIILVLFHKFSFGNDIIFSNFVIGSFVMALGVICYFFLSAIIEILAFWADNIWSIGILLKTFIQFFGGYLIPLSFYPEYLQNFLSYTPIPYLIYYPIQIFLGKSSIPLSQIFTVLSFWTLLSFVLFRIIWIKGNKQYTGAGI